MINFNKKDSVASAVDSILKKEEVEQIDELSKTTLGSYVKKATTDAVVSRKLASDFQHKSERAKNVRTKGAASRLSGKFMDDTIKRKAGIDKAVKRLTKEESESVD